MLKLGRIWGRRWECILFKDWEEIEQGWILAHHPGFHGNRLGEFQLKVKEIKTRICLRPSGQSGPGGLVYLDRVFVDAYRIYHYLLFFPSAGLGLDPGRKRRPKGESRTEILIGGTAHKNRGAFVRKMEQYT